MRRCALTISACLLAAALVLGGCHKAPPPAGRPPTPVAAATATRAAVPVMVEAFGRLRALNDVDIQPQVSGKIIEAPFTEGAAVEQGAVLFRIEPDAYQAALDQAAAQVASAEAALAQKRATLERNRKLLKQSLIAQEDYDKLATDVQVAAAQLDQYRAAHAQAQVNLNYCTIAAPVAGRVGKRLVDPGNVVAPGAGQTLVNLRTLDPLYLDFTLSEAFLPKVRQAMDAGPVDVLIVAEAAGGEPGLHQGRLQMLDNAVDTRSGTIALRAVVPNPARKLWPGQFVYASPILGVLTNAVLVPQSAVTDGKNGPYAFVIQDNKAVVRMVERGPIVGQAVVAAKGIDAGDVVITAGQLGVGPGAAVQVKTEPDEAARIDIRRRQANPNTLALIRALAAQGEDAGQIGLIVGLPPANVHSLLAPPGAKP